LIRTDLAFLEKRNKDFAMLAGTCRGFNVRSREPAEKRGVLWGLEAIADRT
jgi:hypothetical protein